MIIAITLLLIAQPAPADTVRLTLRDAIERALESNPSLQAERAEARAAARGSLEATRAFLPTLRIGAQGIRTTDPVAVFGLKLRQENFQATDLGLDPLNRPDPYAGYSTSATVELPILAPEGLFGYSAARRAAAAREAGTRRAAGATRFFVTQTYWDAQLAARRLEALDTALAAARSHAAQAEALRTQGLVTGLDARLARVHAAGVEVQRLAADAQAENALSALRAMLALPDSTPLLLSDSLATTGESLCESAGDVACDLGSRGDLTALRLGADAAKAAARSAWASNLPAVALFGTAARYGQSSPWGDGSGDWTIGIGVTWTPFRGLGGVGAVGKAKADQHAAEARLEAAERDAEVQVASARRMLAAARERVAVATAAADEAHEALEQARLRYRTGASSITELLDVQAAATNATLSLLEARRDSFVAQTALDFAYGVYDQ